jgi:hypothetical protein
VSFFSAFALTYGLMLVSMAVMASWLFRSAGAPLLAKVGAPVLIVALACVTPLEVNPMMGLPVTASTEALPQRAQLIAFVPHDDAKLVDLWLRRDEGPPRAYETTLDDRMKKTLREARQELDNGRPAMLAMRKPTAAGSANDLTDDQNEYVLDDSVRSALPPKE